MINHHSVWAQSSLPTRIIVGVVAIVGSMLLFIVESIYGNSSGLISSIIWAFTPPVMFAASILFLSVGPTGMRKEQIAWYKQPHFFSGIGLVLQASGLLIMIIVLALLGSTNHIPPTFLIVFLDIICLFLIFMCIMQSITLNQKKYMRKDKLSPDQSLH